MSKTILWTFKTNMCICVQYVNYILIYIFKLLIKPLFYYWHIISSEKVLYSIFSLLYFRLFDLPDNM